MSYLQKPQWLNVNLFLKNKDVCTEAGMYAMCKCYLYVTQEDFEMAV